MKVLPDLSLELSLQRALDMIRKQCRPLCKLLLLPKRKEMLSFFTTHLDKFSSFRAVSSGLAATISAQKKAWCRWIRSRGPRQSLFMNLQTTHAPVGA